MITDAATRSAHRIRTALTVLCSVSSVAAALTLSPEPADTSSVTTGVESVFFAGLTGVTGVTGTEGVTGAGVGGVDGSVV